MKPFLALLPSSPERLYRASEHEFNTLRTWVSTARVDAAARRRGQKGPPVEMSERSVEVGDVCLSIAEAGAGKRPLLLVHGFTGAKEDFTPWLPMLAETGWHAVAPDLRGHGSSSKPAAESDYTFELMARDMLGLADALGWDRFVLLGHSMGGMVAQFVACDSPARLDGLILMDTSHRALDNLDPALVDAAASIVRTEGMAALAAILAEQRGPLDTAANQRLLAAEPGYAEFCDRKFLATAPAMYAAMAPAFVTAADRLESLADLPGGLPVLVLVGEQDAPFLEPSARMAACVGDASLAVISDAGHCPQFENSRAWWEALAGFLAGIASGAATSPSAQPS
jgi:pimeloyl-ACP methyl ester carboxylesterase